MGTGDLQDCASSSATVGQTFRSPEDLPLLSVIIPVFNEASHLSASLETVQRHLSQTGVRWEIWLVDDGSADATWEIVRAHFTRDPVHFAGVRLSRNFGKEAALTAGLEHARGDAVVIMDADLQHPPDLLAEMIRAWREEGYEIVEAVKEQRGQESALSRIGAKYFYPVFARLSGLDIHAATDFKLLTRRVVDNLGQLKERGVFFRGMVAWLGFRRKRLPFSVPARAQGTTRWSPVRLARLAITAIVAFSHVPLYLMLGLAAVFFVFSALLGVQTLFHWITGTAVSGFTTVILLNLIIGSFTMTALGIIGIYLGRIYEEVKMRPRYVVGELLKTEAKS